MALPSSSSSLALDTGLLTVSQLGPVSASALSASGPDRDRYMTDLVTDGIQSLIRELFTLPVQPSDDGRVVILPSPTTLQLPREKPLPKKREPTTWQKFAQRKGIQSRGKRDRLQYDDAHDDWRPRYGRNRANDADAQQWCIEHKDGVMTTSGGDPWAEAKAAKKARVDKNRQQQERNHLTGAKGRRLPGAIDLGSATQRPIKGAAKAQKGHVAVAYDIAAASTASMGAFDRKVSSLEPAKDKAGARAKLHARASVRADVRAEKSANLALLSRILGGGAAAPTIDKDKAANLHQAKSERKVQRAKKR